MGDVSIGALMGSNQSFEDGLTGWTALTAQGSASTTSLSVSVHSSVNALWLHIADSLGGNEQGRRHDYFADYTTKAFPDVTTHTVVIDAWGRVDTWSAGFLLELGGMGIDPVQRSDYFPFVASPLARRRVSGNAYLGVNSILLLDAQILGAWSAESANCLLDDVMARVDEITLYPTYDMQIGGGLKRQLYRSMGGDQYTYRVRRNFSFNVPLELLSTSHTNLINRWWKNDFNLLFTLDTSDAESSLICKLVNEEAPITAVDGIGRGTWKGTLQLLCVNDGRMDF